MRCWGHRSDAETKGLAYSRTDCAMESRVFVSGALTTGFITLRHEAYDGTALGTLRFANRYSKSFQNEPFVAPENPHLTATRCHERYVDREGLPVRAVLCLAAYKKLTGLYQLGLLMYHMHTGRSATEGAQQTDMTGFVSEGTPRAMADALGTPFAPVISKLLRRREGYRYQSAREVWEDLRKCIWW